MKAFRSLSSHFLLGLVVTAPTVFLYTVSGALAQQAPKSTLVKPTALININKTLNSRNPGVIKLLQQAKNDPEFYNLLIKNPSQALANVDYLDPATKTELSKLILEEINTGKLSPSAADGCTLTVICGSTCGHTSSLPNSLDTPTTLPAEKLQQQLR